MIKTCSKPVRNGTISHSKIESQWGSPIPIKFNVCERVGKRENTDSRHFLLFPPDFLKYALKIVRTEYFFFFLVRGSG